MGIMDGGNNFFSSLDAKLDYILREFNISEEEMFSNSKKREIVDARGVLFALMTGVNSMVISRFIHDWKGFKINRTTITRNISNAYKFHKQKIDNYGTEKTSLQQGLQIQPSRLC
jgi:hypothetical protein